MISNASRPINLHNRPADDFFERQPNPFGVRGFRRQIAQVPAAMGQSRSGNVMGLAQFCGNGAQCLFGLLALCDVFDLQP